jgi:hypothetical protein
MNVHGYHKSTAMPFQTRGHPNLKSAQAASAKINNKNPHQLFEREVMTVRQDWVLGSRAADRPASQQEVHPRSLY